MGKLDNETKEEARVRVAEWRRRKGIAVRKPAAEDDPYDVERPARERAEQLAREAAEALSGVKTGDDLADALKELEATLDEVKAATGDFVAGGGSPTKQGRTKKQVLGEGAFDHPTDSPAFLKAAGIDASEMDEYLAATGAEDAKAQQLTPRLLTGTVKSFNAVLKCLGIPVSTSGGRGAWSRGAGVWAQRDVAYRDTGSSWGRQGKYESNEQYEQRAARSREARGNASREADKRDAMRAGLVVHVEPGRYIGSSGDAGRRQKLEAAEDQLDDVLEAMQDLGFEVKRGDQSLRVNLTWPRPWEARRVREGRPTPESREKTAADRKARREKAEAEAHDKRRVAAHNARTNVREQQSKLMEPLTWHPDTAEKAGVQNDISRLPWGASFMNPGAKTYTGRGVGFDHDTILTSGFGTSYYEGKRRLLNNGYVRIEQNAYRDGKIMPGGTINLEGSDLDEMYAAARKLLSDGVPSTMTVSWDVVGKKSGESKSGYGSTLKELADLAYEREGDRPAEFTGEGGESQAAFWEREYRRPPAWREHPGEQFGSGSGAEERSGKYAALITLRDNPLALGRDWPQCDGCGAREAAERPNGEPWAVRGEYLCVRCASKVQKMNDWYANGGMSGQGEEGNEDDGNYTNPDERPLYQRTGQWPDELWTDTTPREPGDDSDRYYLNKALGDAALVSGSRVLALADGNTQCAVGVVVQPDGTVLLGRKDDDGSDIAGQMVFPGGHVEAGEGLGRAAQREVWEETGVWTKPQRLLGSTEKDGNEVWFVQLETADGEPGEATGGTVDDVMEEADFYPPETLENDLNRQVLEYAVSKPVSKAVVDASREPYGGVQEPDPERESEEYYLNKAALADRALAAACEGVFLTAVAKGVDGADVRTALAVVGAGSILSMGFDPQRADWTMEGRGAGASWTWGLGTTLERVARLAKAGGHGTLYNAATTTKDLVDKFRPASYDDIRQGVDAADSLLENLGYDEPTIRKANRAEDGANWYREAGTAVRRALEMLSSDEVAKAVGDDRSLQLADAREELELLLASMALDSRVRLGDQDTTIHGEGAGGFGRGELDVVNNTAPETLGHVDEANDLLEATGYASDHVEENPIPSGQRTQGGPGGFGGQPDGNGQGIHNAVHETPDDSIDPKEFQDFVYGPKAQRAQWETGQRIADAAWDGEPYDQVGISKAGPTSECCNAPIYRNDNGVYRCSKCMSTVNPVSSKGQSGQPGWQMTDPTDGMWDHHDGGELVTDPTSGGEGAGHLKDWHPNGDSGRSLDATVVSRAKAETCPDCGHKLPLSYNGKPTGCSNCGYRPASATRKAGDPDAPEGFEPEPEEDAPEPGRVPVDPEADKPRIYKADYPLCVCGHSIDDHEGDTDDSTVCRRCGCEHFEARRRKIDNEDATDMTTHVGGGRTFNDGPMPSHGTFRTVAQHVPSVQSIESQESVGARPAELDGPIAPNLDTTPNRGDTAATTPTNRGSSRVRRSTGVAVATGPSPITPPSHLQVPPEAVDTEDATETREPDDGHYIPDADQRGADVNPLSLAQGDDDVRVLSRAYAQLFRNVVSDPTVRFAVLRRAADGTEQEIAVDWDG